MLTSQTVGVRRNASGGSAKRWASAYGQTRKETPYIIHERDQHAAGSVYIIIIIIIIANNGTIVKYLLKMFN